MKKMIFTFCLFAIIFGVTTATATVRCVISQGKAFRGCEPKSSGRERCTGEGETICRSRYNECNAIYGPVATDFPCPSTTSPGQASGDGPSCKMINDNAFKSCAPKNPGRERCTGENEQICRARSNECKAEYGPAEKAISCPSSATTALSQARR